MAYALRSRPSVAAARSANSAVLGSALGAYYGGLEGKPMMNAALAARPVEHAHKRRAERPPEEDALVAFVREGTRMGASSRG